MCLLLSHFNEADTNRVLLGGGADIANSTQITHTIDLYLLNDGKRRPAT